MEYRRFNTMVLAGSTSGPSSLVEFFKDNGLEVIDNRASGGALWVVGTRAEIGHIIRKAGELFCAGGTYMEQGGKAVRRRAAWFTKCRR